MKKTKKQRLFSILLAVSVLLSVSACSSAETSSSSSLPSGEISSQQESSENKEIRVMMPARPEGPISNDLPFIQAISEKADVTFQWELAPSDTAQYTEKFNILIASGDMPDLMMNTDVKVLNNGGANGIFEDLLPLIEQGMPNVQKLLDEREDMKRTIMTDDGHIYYLPRITAVKTYEMFLVRQDVLEKYNLEVPETTDEMYEFLKTLKGIDLNGNGEADEIPWTCRNKFPCLNGFFEPFGLFIKDEFFEEDGKVKFTFSDSRFRDGLEYVSKLYAEGLIDGEFATNDIKVWESRVTNELSAITYDCFVRIDYLNNLVQQVNSDALFASIPPLKNAQGEQVTKDSQSAYSGGTAVNAKSDCKEAIMRLINWINSEEGTEVVNFGIEGETFVKKDGIYEYTDLIMKDSDSSGMSKLCQLGFRDKWPYQTSIDYENAMNSDYQNEQRDSYTQYIHGEKWPSSLTYTEEADYQFQIPGSQNI